MDDGTMETAALRIGCKVNLTLRITGVRPNGWHELDTVFLPLDEPSDTLRLALRPGGGLALHCAEPGIDPENNTLTKAYRLFAEASGFRPGVEAVLEKGDHAGTVQDDDTLPLPRMPHRAHVLQSHYAAGQTPFLPPAYA